MLVNHNEHSTLLVAAGEALTVVAAAASSGTVVRLGDKAGDAQQSVTGIAAGETRVFGPFARPARFEVVCAAGSLTYAVAPFEVKRYVALLTQTGTSAPVATELENSLGATPTFSYVDVGFYSLNLTGAFTSARMEKIAFPRPEIILLDDDGNPYVSVKIFRVNDDTLHIRTGLVNGSLADDILSSVEIRYVLEFYVYP